MIWLLGCATKAGRPAEEPPPDVGAESAKAESPDAVYQRVEAFHQTRPTYETPLDDGRKVPTGLASLSAESCGACHTQIYEEWKTSTHAAAWTDRQFQEEIKKSGNRWLCLNCHTPLLIQQDKLPVGLVDDDVEVPVLVDNPLYDESLRNEGITCASCHVVDGVIQGPGLAESTAPHPVQANADFRSNAICERCHQAVATYPGKSFICVFNTGNELRDHDDQQKCADCHMPSIKRVAGIGGPERTVARHWWRGAGIPKSVGVHPPPEANPPGLAIEAAWGDSLTLTAQNANAGHLLPTGDPERWIQIDVAFSPGDKTWQHRIGQVWEWHPEPKQLSDNRLKPKESRSFEIPIPAGATQAAIVVQSHRMTPQTAEYHHLTNYPLFVETHRYTVTPEGLVGGVTAP